MRLPFCFVLSFQLLVTNVLSASNPPYSLIKTSPIEDWRFGGTLGFSFYVTNQMDYVITTNYGDFKELIPSFQFAVYKKKGNRIELGIAARKASMLTLKSENTQGTQCDYQDAQFNLQYSLNENIGLTRARITWNAQIGLGAVSFRSSYFTINKDTKDVNVIISAVGYGPNYANGQNYSDYKTVVVGNLGFNFGYRLSQNISVYFENSLNISTSNKMTGNLFKRSWIPPDSYFFSGIGIYINFGHLGKGQKLFCPPGLS